MKTETQVHEMPSDVHLVLLCLDYLIDLRRSNDANVLYSKKQLDADHISLAIYALMRSIRRPDYLAQEKGDAMEHVDMGRINDEVLSPSSTFQRPYDLGYDDLHPSNLYRFFELRGLAGGLDHGPMLLTDLVEAGLRTTAARCRLEAEKDIVRSTQFEHYIQSVTNRGFFNDPANSARRKDPREEVERRTRKSQVYKGKYRKAIAKYREKLAVNVAFKAAEVQILPPPNSPQSRTVRRDRKSGFSSPPRTCQMRMKEGPMSPLTPTTLEQTCSPSTPTTPKALASELQIHKTPIKSGAQEHTPVSRAITPKQMASTCSSALALATSVSSHSPAVYRIQSSPCMSRVPVGKSDLSPPARYNSFSTHTPGEAQDLLSTTKKPKESPQSTLGKMARRGAFSTPKESPLDERRRSRSRSASRWKRLESQLTNKPANTGAAAKKGKPGAPAAHKATEMSTASHDLNGPLPTALPVQANHEVCRSEISPRRCISPRIEDKVKTFSLYEFRVPSLASTGGDSTTVLSTSKSPRTRCHKSEYEKKLEEQKRSPGWAYPPALALPDISGLAAMGEKEKYVKQGHLKRISTSTSQETNKTTTITTSKASLSGREIKNNNRGAGIAADFSGSSRAGQHPCSPVALVASGKSEDDIDKLGQPQTFPPGNTEGMPDRSQQRFTGSKEACSLEDKCWFQGTQRISKIGPCDSKVVKPIKKHLSLRNGASNLHMNSGGTSSLGNPDSTRMPTKSPKAELHIDPFNLTPPKFLGSSQLFATTIGTGKKLDRSRGPGVVRNPSPQGMPSPRHMCSSPRNFKTIKRAC